METKPGKIVRTVCQSSHSECGVLARVVEGRVVEVRGDPEHPMNWGARWGLLCRIYRAKPLE